MGSSPVPERSVGGHVDGQTDRQADRQNDILTCTCWHCLPVWQPAREKKRHCKRVGDNNQPLSFVSFYSTDIIYCYKELNLICLNNDDHYKDTFRIK